MSRPTLARPTGRLEPPGDLCQATGNRTSPDARVTAVTRLAAAMVLTFPLLISLDWVSATSVVTMEILSWLGLHLFTRRGLQIRRLALRTSPFLIAAPLAGLSLALYGDPGGQTYLQWGLIQVSEQSVSYALAVASRVIALGMAVVVTLDGVDPTDMADGLAQIWHLPARFVLGVLGAVRLVWALRTDWKTMEMARRTRGLGDHRAIRRFASLAFALLVSAIRRGSTLATAMEARGLGPGKRTWARPVRLGWPDFIYLLGAGAIITAGLAIAWATGHFRWIGGVI